MARGLQRFTIYDVMDHKGVFDTNPANPQSVNQDGESIYSGPVEFPKMLYHPEGLTRITVPAEMIVTPMGPKLVGEQREIIHRVVNSRVEEESLLAQGWHQHPARAISAAGGTAPEMSPSQTIDSLQAQIERLQALVSASQLVPSVALPPIQAPNGTKIVPGKEAN